MTTWIAAFGWFCFWALFFGRIGWATVLVLWSVPAIPLVICTQAFIEHFVGRRAIPSYRTFARRWTMLVCLALLTQFGPMLLPDGVAMRASAAAGLLMGIAWLIMLLGFAGVTAVTLYSVVAVLGSAPGFGQNGLWARLSKCINGIPISPSFPS